MGGPGTLPTKLGALLGVIGGAAVSGVNAAPDAIDWDKILDPATEKIIEAVRFLLDPDKMAALFRVAMTTSGIESASDVAGDLISSLFGNALVEESAEILGRAIISPFISLMLRYSDDEGEDPEDFAAAFHGLSILLTLPEFGARILQGHAVATVLGPIGDAFKSIYWNLGLGFLGWQTLAPLLSEGLQPRLQRHYAAKFRPQRLDIGTLVTLYSLGEVDLKTLSKEYQELGWRLEDVQHLLEFQWKTLSRPDIADLLQSGDITDEEAIREIIKQGYNPKFATSVLANIKGETSGRDKTLSASRIRNAYEKNLIDTTTFVMYYRDMGFSSEAIELELKLVQFDRDLERRELTFSQVRQHFVEKIIDEPEARQYLNAQHFAPDDIERILKEWALRRAPKVLKLNRSSVLKAMRYGIYSRAIALGKLIGLGYSPEEANTLVKTEIASRVGGSTELSLTHIVRGYSIGAITYQEFVTELTARGWTSGDIEKLRAISEYQDPDRLNVIDIERAYKAGEIDRGRALSLMGDISITPDVGTLRLNVWATERENVRLKLTAADLVIAYQKNVITSQELLQRLRANGLTVSESEILLASADKVLPRNLNTGEIEQLYYTNIIDRGRTVALLVETGLDTASANDLVKSYEAIVQSNIPTPSVSQLIAAFQNELLTEGELTAKLRELGYGNSTIQLYIELANGPTIEVSKTLTKADVLGLYKDGQITYDDALTRLTESGYAVEDAELLLSRKSPQIEDSQAHRLFMSGYIPADEYYDVLLNLGFSSEDIEEYLNRMLETGGNVK